MPQETAEMQSQYSRKGDHAQVHWEFQLDLSVEEIMIILVYNTNDDSCLLRGHSNLSFQPMFPPKPFDCSGGLAAFSFFLKKRLPCSTVT